VTLRKAEKIEKLREMVSEIALAVKTKNTKNDKSSKKSQAVPNTSSCSKNSSGAVVLSSHSVVMVEEVQDVEENISHGNQVGNSSQPVDVQTRSRVVKSRKPRVVSASTTEKSKVREQTTKVSESHQSSQTEENSCEQTEEAACRQNDCVSERTSDVQWRVW
jgi:hypothetical protein